MNYFLTSDTHFGHENIIEYCKRPFSSIKEMDEALISNWNATVHSGDIVYHLGDFAFTKCNGRKSGKFVDDILSRLNGRIIIIAGSHDKSIYAWQSHFDDDDPPRSFTYQPDYPKLYILPKNTIEEVRLNGNDVILSHCPMLSWERRSHGSIHFFGHLHSNPKIKEFFCSQNSWDVGVDNNNFTPISLNNAIERAKDKFGKLMYSLTDELTEEKNSSPVDHDRLILAK